MMYTPSSYIKSAVCLPPPPLTVKGYYNSSKDIDVCPDCYSGLSDTIIELMQPVVPIYSWEDRNNLRKCVFCDICKRSFVTVADICLLLRTSGLPIQDIARAAASFMWNDSEDEFIRILVGGDYTNEKAVAIKEEIFTKVRIPLATKTNVATTKPSTKVVTAAMRMVTNSTYK